MDAIIIAPDSPAHYSLYSYTMGGGYVADHLQDYFSPNPHKHPLFVRKEQRQFSEMKCGKACVSCIDSVVYAPGFLDQASDILSDVSLLKLRHLGVKVTLLLGRLTYLKTERIALTEHPDVSSIFFTHKPFGWD
jgi:hypothetical protein